MNWTANVMQIAGGLICAAFLIGLIALVVWIVSLAKRRERQRTEALRIVTDQLGLQFDPQGDHLISPLGRFKLFSRGSAKSRKITNVLHGTTDDVEVGIFDYRYTFDQGENGSQTWKQSIVSFRSPLLDLPDFNLGPENLFHKIGQVFGYKDFDFESNPAFSKAFLLRGSDEARIRAIFDDEVLATFERTTGVSVEGEGDRLIYYRSGVLVAPADVRSFMDEGFKVYLLFRGRGSEDSTSRADRASGADLANDGPGGAATTDELE